MSGVRTQRASFGSVLAVAEFRWLWLAAAQSLVGDQLARVALAVLVYTRTGSGLWTAATYALTYLPALLGGLFLGWMADRFPRRGLLMSCALGQAMLFATMATPGLSLGVLAGLLSVATVIGAVFKSAEPALVADLVTGARYTAAIGLRTVTTQTAQLMGFAAGGAAVAAIGARSALAVDTATFVVSAALLRFGLRPRPAAGSADDGQRGPGNLFTGLRRVAGNRRLRILLGFAALTGLWITPEGLAAPYAASTGGGAVATGILMAANPTGNVLGAVVFSRLPAARQRALLGPLAVLAAVPMIACAPHPGLVPTIALWAAAGACATCLVQVSAEYVSSAPARWRGQAVGVLGAAMFAAQGLGLLLGGVLAQATSTWMAIAIAGAIAVAFAVALATSRARAVDPVSSRGTARSSATS